MATEIERKFLVTDSGWKKGKGTLLKQGYLNRDKERTVRVRIAGAKAYLAVKSLTIGAMRSEFEYEIPVSDAEQLLKMCAGPLVEKTRYKVSHAGLVWEIDEFLGANAGLIVAEVELQHEKQEIVKPEWVGSEITTDARYFNSNLAEHPYTTWSI